MMCNPKHCKKCGMWWQVKSELPTGEEKAYWTCGFKATFIELAKLNQNTVGVISATQSRANVAVEAISQMMQKRKELQ